MSKQTCRMQLRVVGREEGLEEMSQQDATNRHKRLCGCPLRVELGLDHSGTIKHRH